MSFSTNAIDAAVVIVYLVANFVLGVLASRLLHSARGREDDYYLAGRRVPAWVNGVSYAVTLVNADVAPAYCGVAVVVGLPVAWFYMSRFSFGLLLAATLFAVRWYQLGVRTGPEFFSMRFGGNWSRFARLYSSLYGVAIGTIPWIGAGLLGVHMIFSPIFGFDSKYVTLAVVLPVIVSYVWISGYAGVVVTDVAQTAVILVANALTLIAVLYKFGGPQQLALAIQDVLPGHAHEVLSPVPVWANSVLSPLVVGAWMIVSTIGIGGSVALEGQRLFSCPNARAAATMGVWAEVALFAMLTLLTLPTLGVLVLYPDMYHATPAMRETAYGLLLHEFLPTGLLGLALAALLASVMSTVSGHISYSSQTLVNDVCRQIAPDLSDRQAVRIGRICMLLVVTLSVVVMALAESLVGIAIVVSGMFGATLTFSWGQWWWWRVNARSWCAAMLGGPLVYLALSCLLPRWEWWAERQAASPAVAQSMAMLQATIGMALTTLLWISVALLTPPENMQILKNFYSRARPMGFWEPVRRELAAEFGRERFPASPPYLLLAGFVIAGIGAIWIGLGIIATSLLVVGEYVTATVLVLTAVPIAWCFWRLFRWHLDRLHV